MNSDTPDDHLTSADALAVPDAVPEHDDAGAAAAATAAPAPATADLDQGRLEGRKTIPLAGDDLIREVHMHVYQTMGDPDNYGELNGLPREEWRLIDQGRIDEADILRAYAAVAALPIADDEAFERVERFPEVTFDFLANFNCLPLVWDATSVLLAVATPYEIGHLAFLWLSMFQRDASFVLARRALIERQLTSAYDAALTGDDVIDWTGDDEQALRDLAREAPIVRLVTDMFNQAQELGASDIHVEPAEKELAVRFRVDGVLQTMMTPPMNQYPAIASRIKLLAGMNIAERRLPQDGRIDLHSGRSDLDVRVSTVPSMHGESIVLRLLQKDVEIFQLDSIGMGGDVQDNFKHLISMPHGIILVVGPTGSGKTTTLYCVLQLLNSETRKIITIEDPVEYQLPGLTQIQVRPQIGLTFADGLRSIVRQDPDVILVGEIRDRETAEIAIHAALTGHLVLSTLHTNDAAGAVSRLLEMGVESFLISSALLAVMSQRLVRRVCPMCQGSGTLHVDGREQPGRRCKNCQRGYRGRVGIFELMMINDDLRHAINERRDSTEVATIARQHGMRPLREDGEMKVEQGVTSAAEVARVCQLDLTPPS